MTILQTPIQNDESGTPAQGRQRLNAADRLMLVAHDVMRRIGHPGFQCQTHVWLDGRLDTAGFRRALAGLHATYPVVASRLAREKKAGPCWTFGSHGDVEFVEASLEGSANRDVWSYGERLCMTPLDLDKRPPIGFHLLHLPDGRDVLILRFSHALMDGKSPEFVLSEINRIHGATGAGAPGEEIDAGGVYAAGQAPAAGSGQSQAPSHARDEIADHLKRFGRKKRFDAAMQVVRSQLKLPKRSALISKDEKKRFTSEPFRILVREMDEDQTKAATARVRRLCGFANLTPAVLSAALRGVREFASSPVSRRTALQTDVPLNLRLPGAIHPIFRNHVTFIQMSANPREMDDRDALTKALNANMRDQLRRGIDLGNLQMMSFMSKFSKSMAAHLKQRFRDNPISLGFGFLGPVLPALDSLCGRRVDWIYTLNACLSPPGIVLQVNQFRGKMNLILSHIDGCVPEPLANDFLSFIIQDLIE